MIKWFLFLLKSLFEKAAYLFHQKEKQKKICFSWFTEEFSFKAQDKFKSMNYCVYDIWANYRKNRK